MTPDPSQDRLANVTHNYSLALTLLLILALAFALAIPVFLASPVTHASFWIDYGWAKQFSAGLAAGNPYPRWLPDSFGGLGAPVFYFYAPLAFYLVAAFQGLGLSTYPAIVATFIALHAASGVTMHRWLGYLGRGPALMGALVYMALPYHVIDFSRRAAIGEFAAFVVIPLVALGVRRAIAGRGVVQLAIAYALLILAHLPVALLTGVFLVPALALWIGRGRGLIATGTGLMLGITLAAIYLVPALTLQEHTNFAAHWKPGFTPEYWSLLTPLSWREPRETLLIWAAIMGSGFAGLVLLHKHRSFWPLFVIGLCLISGALIPGLWSIPPLPKVQFPFRTMTIVDFALATAVAKAISLQISWRAIALALAPLGADLLMVLLMPYPSFGPTLAELDRNTPEVTEYLPAATDIARISEARRAPDRKVVGDFVVRHRFWFPNVEVRCGERRVPAGPAQDTGLLSYPNLAECKVSERRTEEEIVGTAMSAVAALTLAALTLLRRRKFRPTCCPLSSNCEHCIEHVEDKGSALSDQQEGLNDAGDKGRN